ncbi:MAG: hypothetical protein EOO33_00085 [Comamonadaceae bacterium]|nr:MAG: hypothetical protein EOO33_00085 [Comamonadaceae bacterium]
MHIPTSSLPAAPTASRAQPLTAFDWLLRVLAACALAGALGGCDRAPDVPTFEPPPPGAPVPQNGASHAANPG